MILQAQALKISNLSIALTWALSLGNYKRREVILQAQALKISNLGSLLTWALQERAGNFASSSFRDCTRSSNLASNLRVTIIIFQRLVLRKVDAFMRNWQH